MSDAELDDLTSFVVATNQGLAVMSRVGAPEAELRAIVGLAVGTVTTALNGRRPARTTVELPNCAFEA